MYVLHQPWVLNNVLLKWQKVSGISPYQPGNGWYGELCCAQVGFSSTPRSQIILTLLIKCVEGNTWRVFFDKHTFVLVWTFFTLAKNYWHGFSTGVTVFIFNSNASIAVLDIKPIKWFKNNISWSNSAFYQALEMRGSKWNESWWIWEFWYEKTTDLFPFVRRFPGYTDPVGVCRSLELRERPISVGGDLHSCSAEICPGLFFPLPSVWKCSSCSWEAFIVSTIKYDSY